jgi:hypothetical protein
VLEANASSEEERDAWVKDIKAVFKEELSPAKEFVRTTAKPDDIDGVKSEKDCQCVLM